MTSQLRHQFEIRLQSHTYPLVIAPGLLDDQSLIQSMCQAQEAMIVTNKTIAPMYLDFLMRALRDKEVSVFILDDGEQYKNQASLFALYEALLTKKHHRDTTLFALGGGVVGDLCGFAAATYQRGVRFVQIPTTLLAQVDASLGGKTAINHPLGKNMIGSFYQPYGVLIDVNTLSTLPLREFNAGLAEVIKYGLLKGGEFLDFLTVLLQKERMNSVELTELIFKCCQIKAHFIETDEKETHHRALLNLGHTFAHALETITNYEEWLHGEAVGIGLYCAALLSAALGHLSQSDVLRVDTLLQKAHLARRIPASIDLDALIALMMHDKKVKDKRLRFVLIHAFGHCYLENEVPMNVLKAVLKSAVEGECE